MILFDVKGYLCIISILFFIFKKQFLVKNINLIFKKFILLYKFTPIKKKQQEMISLLRKLFKEFSFKRILAFNIKVLLIPKVFCMLLLLIPSL